MTRRILSGVFVSLALAAAIHTDWHFARPEHHRLSLGLAWHWALAIPVFALVAWYVTRVWVDHLLGASLAIVGSAAVLAGIIEPAWEYFFGGATFEWAFGAARNIALLMFVGTGVTTYVVVVAFTRRNRAQAARV